MADRYYSGTNNDWNSTSNWATTRGGATGSAAPTSSDDVYIYDGDIDLTANITGVTAASLVIGGNFRGNIPGMTVATAACVVTIENVAPGKRIDIGAAAATTLALLHVKSAGPGTVNIIAGAAGVLTTLKVGRVGQLLIDGSAVITNYYNAGMPEIIAYSATAFTLAEFRSGTHLLQRSATTITADNGAQVNVSYSGANPAFTTANVGSQATIRHDSAGTIGTLNAFPGGTLAPVNTKFTVTNTNLWEGANVNRNSDKITFSNAPVPFGNPT